MAMTRAEWNALQARLPEEDRSSYEDYLTSIGAVAPATSFTPSQLAAGESGAIGAASIASQMAAATAAAEQTINQTAANAPANAGTVVDTNENPPTEGLKAGYEWYKFNKPGGGFEWRQRPTRETLAGSYTYLFGGGATGGTGGNAGAGGGVGGTGGGTTAPTQTYTAPDGRIFTDLNAYNSYVNKLNQEAKQAQSQSAFDFLLSQFTQYGLQALVEPLRDLIKQGVPASEFTIRLRETDAYKKRFAANAQRINKGLRVLSEAEYIKLEDDYQDVMRRYGLPASYYERGELGRQQGFEKFIAGDVSAPELEKRIQMAQERVMDADPMIGQTLREFYPSITNGEILAFALDPDRALPEINRKITAAEIGSAQYGARLVASRIRAEELAAAGVTGKQYQQAAPTIADIATRGSTLAQFYEQAPFGQAEAEQETLGISGAAEARERRRRLTALEQASFAGRSGPIGGALNLERAGAI